MGIRRDAFRKILDRYAAVLSLAWRQRREMEPVLRKPHEAEFLPAALVLQETPLHPAPHVALGLIMMFAVLALAWSVFGQVDIVATAAGRVIPGGHTKVVQPLETAVVTAIHVREGQRISAGDLLIELDSTAPKADAERLRNELLAASFASARAGAMLHVLGTGDEPVMPQVSLEVDRERVGTEAQVLAGEYGEFAGRLAGLRAEIQRRRAERNTMLALVHKLEQTVLLARKRAEDYGMLVEKNYVARHAWSEIEQIRIEQEQDLVAQRARIVEIDAAIAESLQTRDTFLAEARKALLDRRQDADRQVAAIGQELRKAVQRDTQTRLVAPVSGVVQQLAAHTVGGVVTPAQPLMVVVPEATILEVEAFLPNKDIGFVLPGQEARIKLETFPFTRYGTIDGVVVQVSGDAIQDERMGLVYSTRVRLLKNRLQVGEREVSLSPGMATIVEIRTGGQRVIEYLLGPLLRYKDESLRER